MKKNLLFCLLLSATTSSFAQWYIGINAGPTLSNYKSKTPWKEVSNLGLSIGASAFKQVNTNLGINFELQYIQKGYYHKICNSISDKLQATYLEIPIMVDYTFVVPAMRNFKGHANLGLYSAYWLSGKYKTKGFSDASQSFDFNKNKASHFDFGPNIGGKVEYVLKNGSLFLNFRYELGLMDLQKKINDNTKNTNRALIIGFSYLKPIGH